MKDMEGVMQIIPRVEDSGEAEGTVYMGSEEIALMAISLVT